MEMFQVGLLFVYLEQVTIFCQCYYVNSTSSVLILKKIHQVTKRFVVDFAKYYNKSYLTRSRDQPSGNSERC